MYGGKHVAEGDTTFVFASENEGGRGLIARGVVVSAKPIAKKPGVARQTPRMSLSIRGTTLALRPLGRRELGHLTDWNDGAPGTELNFKFYRQATNKIVGISDETLLGFERGDIWLSNLSRPIALRIDRVVVTALALASAMARCSSAPGWGCSTSQEAIMPASSAEVCPAGLFPALLAAACAGLLVCGSASQGLAFDGDFPGSLGAEGQLLGGQTEVAVAPDDPFVSREIGLSGFVEESLEASLVRAGAPADLSLKLKDALSSVLDQRHQLDSGDKFYVRYEQTFAGDGREIGVGRIVSAEVMTAARGRIAFYGFRPTRGAEQLWLASGESLAVPALRLPLETLSVSSGFGVRADPFEQPQHGLGAPSRLGTVGATINTATARGIALGLAPGPGKSAGRGGAAFVMHNGVDLVAPSGTPVLAAASGTIIGAAPNAGYGNWIRIEHAQNVATVYGHLSAFAPGIGAGAKVDRGQVIGFVGNTGRSTGPHLHFEVITNGQAIDPMTFPRTKRARLVGADLERFRKLVQQAEAARQGETAFLLISAGGVH